MSAPPPSRLALEDIRHSFNGTRAVDGVSLEIAAGELVCLLGPSGCGKTTVLRVAAGIECQESGAVWVDGRKVSGDEVHDPPESRSIGLMFQEFALFPHLTAIENVAFGYRALNQQDGRGSAAEYLRRFGLARFADKYPHQLSGGEQQRIALARALAPHPRVLLMDEPFSGLDTRLRDDIRDDSLALLKEEGTAVLLVTHEPGEALRMADRIALMRAGRIVQVGAPYHIYNHPVDRRAAAFFSDINVIEGRVASQQIQTPFGPFLSVGLTEGTQVEIVIRPQHLALTLDEGGEGPAATPETGIPARGTVTRARYMGVDSLVEVRMGHDDSLLRASVPGTFLPAQGAPIWLSLRRDRCFVFPNE